MGLISAGTTIFDAGVVNGIGNMILVSSVTASSSASITFTLADYKEYQFYFVNIHAATSGAEYQFNLSIDSGSNYNVAKTSTAFESYHTEADNGAGVIYQGGADLAQGTGDQQLFRNLDTDNDCSYSGSLKLFNPSSDTFAKHYMARGNGMNTSPTSIDFNVAGYANTASAVDRIQFKMSSGNIDSGKILMFGIN
jgi:hypothetical protein|tara:strand:+ start:2023 stop:2607 length:585 start_codon:yes stop_codon:yes gene_type:complete